MNDYFGAQPAEPININKTWCVMVPWDGRVLNEPAVSVTPLSITNTIMLKTAEAKRLLCEVKGG